MASSPKSLSDHLTLWVRWRWFIIGVVFFASVLMIIISLLMPKTYKSTVRFLPPFETVTAFPFLGGMTVDIFGANEVPTSALIPLLKSRALKDRVHARIDLVEHYEKKDIERAYEAFEDHLEIEIESEEAFAQISIVAIALSVLDRDPEFCAKMVNVVVAEWNDLFLEINRDGARIRKEFIEESMRLTGGELAVVEDSMKTLQEKYGISSIEEQVAGTVQALIELEQQIINAKIAVKVFERIFQPGHPELRRAQLELQELQRQQMELRESYGEESVLLPLGLAPEIGIEYARIYRQVQVLEAIYAVLLQQHEQAKLQELRETPSFRIFDWGKVPIHKYKPRRGILVIMAFFSSWFIALIMAYFLDYSRRNKGTPEYRWVEEITEHLKSDLKRLKKRKKSDTS